jgi:hypothetical protein
MAKFSEQCQGVVAIDGKVLRRSFVRSRQRQVGLHMVRAWGCEKPLVLAQIATDAKSNEITGSPKLLAMLSLKGMIVTADALNCQRAIAQQIVGQSGDYALALKGNQGTLHDDVVRFLNDRRASSSRPSRMSTPITAAAGSRHKRRRFRLMSSGCRTITGGPKKAIAKMYRIRENITC